MRRELVLAVVCTALGLLAGWGLTPTSDTPSRAAEHAPRSADATLDAVGRTGGSEPLVRLADSPAGAERTPVPVAESALSTPVVEEDPCAELREKNARLEELVAYLREQVGLLQVHDGRSPYEDFLQSTDAEMIERPEDREWLKNFMSAECPFYLRPGEALYLVENRGNEGGYETFEEHMIEFLGPERVLREAPPEWLDWMSTYFDDVEWRRIFNEPLPAR